MAAEYGLSLSARTLERQFRSCEVDTAADLCTALDALYWSADRSTIHPDPLELVFRYPDPHDQEVAGFLAAAWAYGRAETILADAGAALDRMGSSPAQFVDRLATGDGDLLAGLGHHTHRLHREGDWVSLCLYLGDLRRRFGSVGAAIVAWRAAGEGTYREALIGLHDAYREGTYPSRIASLAPWMRFGDQAHLLADPTRGSACKRLNLWLRWMVRRDHVDPGPWHDIAPAAVAPDRLTIPVDTHIARLSGFLGLTRYRSPGWAMAADITRSLACLDPADPVRYDFALCRLGILNLCPTHRDPARCSGCPILRWCRS